MNHIAHLDKIPFELIKNNIKHYEYRLNDDKRKTYKINDTITFVLTENNDSSIKVIIKELKIYNNLLDMYTDTFDDYLYDLYKNPEDAVKDTSYYTEEDINKYGCLAIKIEVTE